MEKIKILVVDDKKVVCDLFNFTLGSEGHTVRCVASAAEALEAVNLEHFDMAFLDIVMPGVDGLMLLKQIKSAAPHLPVGMMSGFSVDKKRKQLKRFGRVPVLKKPFDIDDVRRMIKSVLGKEI